MRSTLDLNPACSGSRDQRWQNRLKHKSSAARSANRETKVPGANLARHKRKRFGTQRSPLDFSRANFCRRLDCRQVLPQRSTIYLYPSRGSLRPRYGNTTTERPIFPSGGHGETDEDIVTRNSRRGSKFVRKTRQ